MLSKVLRLSKTLILKKPVFCIFRVTSRCNLTCKMCSIWRHGDKKHELSLKQIEELGKILKKLNISIIALGGGEPLMREDIVDIVRILSKDFSVRMQTNAILATQDKIKALVKAGLRGVSVSLDTLNPDKQDFICGVKGSWYKTVEKMTLFSKFMPKRASLLLSNAVVSKLNIQELPRLAKFVNELGFSAVFLPVLLSEKQEHKYTFRDYAPTMAFTKDDFPEIEKVYQELITMKKQGYGITNSIVFLKDSVRFLKRNYRWNCDAARLYFHIDSDGSFLPCTDIERTGSFLEDNFIKKFHSDEFKKLVNKKITSCPGCMQPCQVEVTNLVHNPEVFLEKAVTMFKLGFKKRRCLNYQEAIKYARY